MVTTMKLKGLSSLTSGLFSAPSPADQLCGVNEEIVVKVEGTLASVSPLLRQLQLKRSVQSFHFLEIQKYHEK